VIISDVIKSTHAFTV